MSFASVRSAPLSFAAKRFAPLSFAPLRFAGPNPIRLTVMGLVSWLV